MKTIVLSAAIVLLSACANQYGAQQAGMSQNKQPPSNFQSVGSCEPTGWAGLEPVSYTHLTLPTNREV